MRIVVIASLLIVAVIHLLPVYGILGARELGSLYGTPELDANTRILMRHRAAMFGVIGLFIAASALLPALRSAGLLVAAGSLISFLALALGGAPYNREIARVVAVDAAALAILMVGALAHIYRSG